jgi:tRNA-splicing ligase RtcB (3'-phosphate/5'-hydroxy nucleic acid ligase)
LRRAAAHGRPARHASGKVLRQGLEEAGILIRGTSDRGLVEEKPEAYKDIDAVAEASHHAGLARKVARLVPLGVVKG